MATASPKAKPRPVSLWRRPLLVGVCFALGYGVMQRLLDLRMPGFVQWGQSFDVRDFPGTSLESLRLRFGSEGQELRGRLDLLEMKPLKPAQSELAEPLGGAVAAPGLEADKPAPEASVREASVPASAPPAPNLPPPPSSQEP